MELRVSCSHLLCSLAWKEIARSKKSEIGYPGMGRRKKLIYEVLIYITPIYMHIIHLPMQCRAILTFPEANCPGLRLNRFGLFLMVASNLQWCIPPTYVNTSHRFGFWCFFKISVQMETVPFPPTTTNRHDLWYLLQPPLSLLVGTATSCNLYCHFLPRAALHHHFPNWHICQHRWPGVAQCVDNHCCCCSVALPDLPDHMPLPLNCLVAFYRCCSLYQGLSAPPPTLTAPVLPLDQLVNTFLFCIQYLSILV